MNTWKAPSVVEVPVGLEIGAYAPAELDVPPYEPPRGAAHLDESADAEPLAAERETGA